MASSGVDLQALVQRRCVLAREEGGVAIYEPRTRVVRRDEASKIQVVAVGEWAAGDVRAVLLLGATGAGKTRALNAMLNVLFGVRFGDPLRLEVPDQRDESPRSAVESQTDYITAYLVYGEAAMPFPHHYLLIDTPGFGDTRSAEQRLSVTERLRKFLTEEPSFDSLHCIGLVTKANENRDCKVQREILSEFTSLLGSDVTGVTHVLATFAVDDSLVDEVLRSAGLQYTDTFLLDNWPLYAGLGSAAALSPRHRASLELRWDIMASEYHRFFEAINNSRPVSLTLTRDLLKERRLLESTLSSIRSQVRVAAQTLSALRVEQRALRQYLRLADQIEWKRDVHRVLRETYKVMKGYHAHNCPQCDRTCVFPCADPSKAVRGVVGAGVGVATGGAVGAVGGIPGAAIGAMIGGAFLGTGSVLYKNDSCSARLREGVCGEGGCMHDLAAHSLDDFRIIRSTVTDEVVDYRAKTRYDAATTGAAGAEAAARGHEEALAECDKQLGSFLRALRRHAERVWELSAEAEKPTLPSVLDQLILDAREDTVEVQLLKVLREAVEAGDGKRRSYIAELRADEDVEPELLQEGDGDARLLDL
ncbi:uncharacterized protein LOC122256246 [Penaeus japonicus]|uniref:uncharacterized protein LOC122256246 n=1 Tax=Penaeus japonicus TaxID=27405 RepID=UPI001C710292|nr:uncharacterized protein LOC122256246 [Penaeus japonicus]XP_042876731.1 uncharacterized protein LOC122256246 [Penaeus japonicus]